MGSWRSRPKRSRSPDAGCNSAYVATVEGFPSQFFAIHGELKIWSRLHLKSHRAVQCSTVKALPFVDTVRFCHNCQGTKVIRTWFALFAFIIGQLHWLPHVRGRKWVLTPNHTHFAATRPVSGNHLTRKSGKQRSGTLFWHFLIPIPSSKCSPRSRDNIWGQSLSRSEQSAAPMRRQCVL